MSKKVEMYELWKTLETGGFTGLVAAFRWLHLIFWGGGRTYAIYSPEPMQNPELWFKLLVKIV